ncbi:MAG: DUF2811 domain-containing protein [Synechococcaceae cyanobacterium]|nr:DUF2811 domain-containing protein [Synechococcaceae cyanobacterium]
MTSQNRVVDPEAEPHGGTVSLCAQVPEPLLLAMRRFIEAHPNWDQYRLFKAALAGFLVQNGVNNRSITRCYLANLFPGQGGFNSPAGAETVPNPSQQRPDQEPRVPKRRVA